MVQENIDDTWHPSSAQEEPLDTSYRSGMYRYYKPLKRAGAFRLLLFQVSARIFNS